MNDVVIEARNPAVVSIEQTLAQLNISTTVRLLEISPNVHECSIDARPVPVVEIEARGLRGVPGSSGNGGGTFIVVAGETIHGERVVRVANGLIYHPDIDIPAHGLQCIGLALQAGAAASALLVRTAGQVSSGAWSWAPGFVWCDDDGVLTQTPPATGWILKVATVVSATTIDIDIDTPFFRS